ncbi:MAG: LemA family protein [Planctomycetota bacterium]|nr:MAG: LemA family protein [Planctomycetota bacterium]
MDPFVIVCIVVGAIVFLILIVVAALYNGLVRKRNVVRNGWSQIDVQLKRRHDLIPNLVETCKGYMKHEKEVLENVTKARGAAIGAQGPAAQGQAENMLTGALKSLFAVVENYPELKANENMLKFQEELTSTENKISYARQHYNDASMVLNNAIEMFPSNMVAGMFGFKPAEFFEIESPAEKEVPKVQF